MQGNVWEWTAETTADKRAVARGGSWYSPPEKALFDARVPYPEWQPVYDVGFRVLIEEAGSDFGALSAGNKEIIMATRATVRSEP
jgi:hypothetical protein